MGNIQKIPFFMAAIASIITGLICELMQMNLSQSGNRMIIVLIIFYFIGLLVKSTLEGVIEENEVKKIQAQNKTLMQVEEGHNNYSEGNVKEIPIFDAKVDDKYDDFTPLQVSEVIRSKIKE